MNYSWVEEYALAKLGSEKEYKESWDATLYKIGGKFFVLSHKMHESEVISVKLEPERGEFLRDWYEDIFPGYHLNKTHWNSIRLNGNVPSDIVKEMIDESYRLVFKGLIRKIKDELFRENTDSR